MKNVTMNRPKKKETRKQQAGVNEFIGCPGQCTTFVQLVSHYEMELISQPDVFLISFLFGRIIVTFFIQNILYLVYNYLLWLLIFKFFKSVLQQLSQPINFCKNMQRVNNEGTVQLLIFEVINFVILSKSPKQRYFRDKNYS